MNQSEAKAKYRRRGYTLERVFADFKTHGGPGDFRDQHPCEPTPSSG